jgi:hypothetical protein
MQIPEQQTCAGAGSSSLSLRRRKTRLLSGSGASATRFAELMAVTQCLVHCKTIKMAQNAGRWAALYGIRNWLWVSMNVLFSLVCF